jgi:hypothetical protein
MTSQFSMRGNSFLKIYLHPQIPRKKETEGSWVPLEFNRMLHQQLKLILTNLIFDF